MADVPGVAVNFPGSPEWEKRVTAPSVTDTTKTLSPVQVAVEGQSLAQAEREKAAVADKTALETDKATIEAQGAAAKEAQTASTIDEKTRVDDAETAKIAKRADELRAANEAIRATPAPALFADRKGWDKAKLGIGLALAGLGDAINAKSSAVLGRAAGPSAVTDIINMDLERQRENIKKLTDSQIMAKEGVKDALAARELALTKVDLKGAALFNLASQHVETLLKAKGMDAPAIAGNEAKLALDRAEVESKKRAVAGLASEHTRAGAKVEVTTRAPTESDKGAPSARMAPVRGPEGKVEGYAPTGEAEKLNEGSAAALRIDKLLYERQQLIREHGERVMNPHSPEGMRMKQLAVESGEALRQFDQINNSDEGQKLAAKIAGGAGVGVDLNPAASVDYLAELRRGVARTIHDRIKVGSGPIEQMRPGAAPVTPAAPAPVSPSPAPAPAAAPSPVAAPTPPIPSTAPMVPPKPAPKPVASAPITSSERVAAIKWAKNEGRGTPKAEEILKAFGLK